MVIPSMRDWGQNAAWQVVDPNVVSHAPDTQCEPATVGGETQFGKGMPLFSEQPRCGRSVPPKPNGDRCQDAREHKRVFHCRRNRIGAPRNFRMSAVLPELARPVPQPRGWRGRTEVLVVRPGTRTPSDHSVHIWGCCPPQQEYSARRFRMSAPRYGLRGSLIDFHPENHIQHRHAPGQHGRPKVAWPVRSPYFLSDVMPGRVTASGVPPSAETRHRPMPSPEFKRIVLSEAHVAPRARGAPHRVITTPAGSGDLLELLSEKKASHFPSGEKNGL